MKTNTFTIKLWVYVSNNGDGSATARFFNTEKEALLAAENRDERFCYDIYPTTLKFDLTNGCLVQDV